MQHKWNIQYFQEKYFYGQMGHFIAILGAKPLNESSKKIVDYFMEVVPDEKLPWSDKYEVYGVFIKRFFDEKINHFLIIWSCVIKYLNNLSKKCQLNHWWSHCIKETLTTKQTKMIKLMDRGNAIDFIDIFCRKTDVYSEFCQTSRLERFAKIVNDF